MFLSIKPTENAISVTLSGSESGDMSGQINEIVITRDITQIHYTTFSVILRENQCLVVAVVEV